MAFLPLEMVVSTGYSKTSQVSTKSHFEGTKNVAFPHARDIRNLHRLFLHVDQYPQRSVPYPLDCSFTDSHL